MNKLEIFKSTTPIGYKMYDFLKMMSNNGECSFSNENLMNLLNVKSNATIVSAKKELKELGLIDFETQRRGEKITKTFFYVLGNSKIK